MKNKLLCASFLVSLFYCFPVFGGCRDDWNITYDYTQCPCSLPNIQFDKKSISCGAPYCPSDKTCMPNGTCCKEPDSELKKCCKFGVSTSTGSCCEKDPDLCTNGLIIAEDGCAQCCDYGTNKDKTACCEVDKTTCTNGYITKDDGCAECCANGAYKDGSACCLALATPGCETETDASTGCKKCKENLVTDCSGQPDGTPCRIAPGSPYTGYCYDRYGEGSFCQEHVSLCENASLTQSYLAECESYGCECFVSTSPLDWDVPECYSQALVDCTVGGDNCTQHPSGQDWFGIAETYCKAFE